MARTLRRGVPLAVALSLALWSGCRCGQEKAAPAGADAAVPASEKEQRSDDDTRPVYPLQVGDPAPLAQRLCESLQGIPAKRRAACCGGAPTELLTSECVRMLTAALTSKAVRVEASAVEACAQAMDQTYQGCDWPGPDAPAPPAACLGIFQGTLAAGARCRSSLECAEGLRCHGLGPTDPGICGPPAPAGQPCSFSVDPLATYTRQDTLDEAHPECQGHCFKRQCSENVAASGACVISAQCGPGRHCAGGACTEGAEARLGQPCSGGDCEQGARCVLGTCVAPKPVGAACERDAECQGGCVRPDGGKQGTCGPRCAAL
jgi:hypothetical protein